MTNKERLCRTCVYGDKTEYNKPCVIYSDNCQLYEEKKHMTNEKTKKMLKAKLECLKRETSGTDFNCTRCNCDECPLNYEQGNIGEQKEALTMAIQALEQQAKTGEWILTSKKLPPIFTGVLITRQLGSGVSVEWGYIDSRNRWANERGYVAGDIVAWMPLPQPYKEENTNGNSN